MNLTKTLRDGGYNNFEIFLEDDTVRIVVVSEKFNGVRMLKRIDMLVDLLPNTFVILNPLTPDELALNGGVIK
jgi:hypothetical protein